MARIVTLLAGLALTAACSSGTGSGAQADTPRDAREAVPVTVASVVQKEVLEQLRAIGNVEAYSTVAVKSQVEGQLSHVHFREGDRVEEGDLLFTIDPRPFEAALRQAEANLAKDRAEAKNAHVQAERYARLLTPGFVSRDQHDQVRTQAASLDAAVKADEAAVDTAKLQLQYCFIHSPITGRVGRLLVHAGNVVESNDATLAVVNQLQPVYVSFSVPEQQLPTIREAAATAAPTVQAFVGNDEAHPVEGKLSFIDNAVDTATGSVLLKGLFANGDETLWPGQFVSVALTVGVQPDALLVPALAIQTGQQGTYVFVVGKDLAAEVRPVVLGRAVNQDTVVAQGLHAGELVVTRGQVRLAAGSKVQIKTDVDAGAQPSAADG